MADKFVLALGTGFHAIVLGLHERTLVDAKQLVTWMNVGGFGMKFAIATYDANLEAFVSEDDICHFPEQGPYTETAWLNFTKSLEQKAAVRRKLKGRP